MMAFNIVNEPIVPELSEVLSLNSKPALHPNLEYSSKTSLQYLDILFRFFREDFLSALRFAISDFKKRLNRRCDDSDDLHLDHNTVMKKSLSWIDGGYSYYIVSVDGDSNEFHTLTFSLEFMGKLNWSRTGRLKNGSLLALSNDKFENCCWFVTVVHRNENVPKNNKTNSVDVRWYGTKKAPICIETDEIWAIEPSTFFEAYRPVLERIQCLARKLVNEEVPVPFDSYIVRGRCDVAAPDYLKPGVRLQIDAGGTSHESLFEYGIPGLNFDTSQREAVYLALTKEFALIEGPPGTGKTYVGVQVVKILMNPVNRRYWGRNNKGTICLMAYTNHAIDHFILECLKVGVDMSNLVRLGGGFCEQLKQYSIWNKKTDLEKSQEYKREFLQLRKLRNEMRDSTSLIQRLEMVPYLEDYDSYISQHNFQQLYSMSNRLDHQDILKWVDGKGRRQKATISAMSKTEADNVMNIFSLNATDRHRLLACWLKQARMDAVIVKDRLDSRIEDLKRQLDVAVMQRADIVAMTTTGASKFANLMEAIRPEIVLVEEAAQALEAHSIAPLTSACRQIIMLGDHWQLRPSISEHVSKDYNLEVSLFERMISQDLPSIQLELQYRMHPEIASILVPNIYPKLDGHHTVGLYPPVKGVQNRVLFICHEGEEATSGEKNSRVNEAEVSLLSHFCKYLLQQGYKQRDITILSIYSEQVQAIKEKLKQLDINHLWVSTVDAYQGEQNKIVLVSFVCSTNIAFLDVHRVSAALSCAKHGFYAMGNFAAYAETRENRYNTRRRRTGRVGHAELWRKLYMQWQSKGIALNYLPIQCPNHPNVTTKVYDASYFDTYAPEGGCTIPCAFVHCFHYTCPRLCHSNDTEHSRYKCQETVIIINSEGERIMRRCFQLQNYGWGGDEDIEVTFVKCEHTIRVHYTEFKTAVCLTPIKVTLPCKHVKSAICCEEESVRLVTCKTPVSAIIPCNYKHQKMFPCYQARQAMILARAATDCLELVKVDFIRCNHSRELVCHTSKNVQCIEKIDLPLDCGHVKKVYCIRKNSPESKTCDEIIDKPLDCGHSNRIYCCQRDIAESSICRKSLRKLQRCGHTVDYQCNQRLSIASPAFECRHWVTKMRVCGHTVSTHCFNINRLIASACSTEVTQVRTICNHSYQGQCYKVEQELNERCIRTVRIGGVFGYGGQTMECYEYRKKVESGDAGKDKCVVS